MKIKEAEELALSMIDNETIVKSSMAAAYAVQDMFDYGDNMQTPKNISNWIELYTNHVWAYAGIFAIASTIAQLNFKLLKVDKETGDIEEIRNHPILNILKNPNPDITGFDLLEALVIYLETSGNEYFEIVYETKSKSLNGKTIAASKEPIELWPIRPDRITPKPRKDGKGIDYYEFQNQKYAKKYKFNPKNILPFSYFNPMKDWFGMGSLQPTVNELQLDKQMVAWNLDFFRHGTTPEGLLRTDKRLTPKEVKDLGEQIKQFLSGKGRTVLILSKGLEWQTVSVDPKDIEFLAGRKENRQAILAALGVTPVKVGLLENAKYDNYGLQIEAFHRDTIVPKTKKIEGCFQKHLLSKYESLMENDTHYYLIQFDKTPLLKEDEDKLVKRYILMMDNALLTPNQALKKLGYDPYPADVEFGDRYYVKKNLVPVDGMGVEESEDDLEMREDVVSKRLDILEDDISGSLEMMKNSIKEEVMQELSNETD